MTAVPLGFCTAPRGPFIGIVAAFIFWLDARASIAVQLPPELPCPACDARLSLAHLKTAQSSVADPRVSHTSVQCGTCGAALHFDTTSEDERARMSWLRTFWTDRAALEAHCASARALAAEQIEMETADMETAPDA